MFCAAITRDATTLWATTVYGLSNDFLDDNDFMEMITRELRDGQHIKKPNTTYKGMGRSFFHLPAELKEEIVASGFQNVNVRGILGPAWLVPNLDEQWKNPERRENIMRIVRLLEKEDAIMGLSTHILSIASK